MLSPGSRIRVASHQYELLCSAHSQAEPYQDAPKRACFSSAFVLITAPRLANQPEEGSLHPASHIVLAKMVYRVVVDT